MLSFRGHVPAGARGVASLEFALAAPIMLILTLSGVDAARAYLIWSQLHYTANAIVEAAAKMSITTNASTGAITTQLTADQMQQAMTVVYAEIPQLNLGNGGGLFPDNIAVVLSSVSYTPLCKAATGCGGQTAFLVWSSYLDVGGPTIYRGFNRLCGNISPVARFKDTNANASEIVSPVLAGGTSMTLYPQLVADVLYSFHPFFSIFHPHYTNGRLRHDAGSDRRSHSGRDAQHQRVHRQRCIMQLASSAWPRRLRHASRDRKGAVALLVATMIIPLIGLVGLAIDYGIWNEAYASLSLAASSAALNAAKFAASADANADSNYITEGVTAGKQWFLAELGQGSYAADNGAAPPTVTISVKSNVITATVSYTSTVKSVFGKIYKKASYPISVNATATMSAGSYLEVVLMLDNSSSMSIGATQPDISTLMQQSPCDKSNEYTRTSSSSNYSQLAGQNYSEYQLSWQGNTYDGTMTYPVTYGSLTLDAATPSNSTVGIPYCYATTVSNGTCQLVEQCPTNVNGYAAYAGPPCAFACHWDTSAKAGLGTDLWALARQKGVTLRLDTLKNATQKVLTAMNSNNMASINNLSVGIYTFNTTLNPIYPGTNCTPQAFGCEAGSDWSTASSDVGLPPQTTGVYIDTGIQPPVATTGGNNDNTEVEEAMSNLANNYVTAAGDGSSATKPRKILILITDGMEDDPTGTGYSGMRQAMPYSACTPFKTMGYTVYVIYTPYYPLLHEWYLASGMPIVEGSGANSITYNLTACATNTNDFVKASDQATLNADLLAFLTDALDAPATFTQ